MLTQLLYYELQTRGNGGQALHYKSPLCLCRPGLPALWAFHCNP
jgi:hypothetical protein